MIQRTDEWSTVSASALLYHTTQWDTPKRSTVAFGEFCRNVLGSSKAVLDLGAGTGAPTAFLAEQFSDVNFTACDYSHDLVDIGRTLSRERNLSNLSFAQGDWFNLEETEGYDGVISLQTLSWLPEYQRPLQEIMTKIKPRWIGLTSLFYEGDISCTIEINEHKNDRKTFYNVYSIPDVERFLSNNGYGISRFERFHIDIDIDKPANPDYMGTYTRRVFDSQDAEGERLQISGPLLMNWYMLLIERL